MRPIHDLASFSVGQQQLPTLHYIPDAISVAEEQRLLQEVHASKAKWVQLSGRRLQNHGGIVHSKGLIPAPLPSWLQQLLQGLPPPLLQMFPPEQPPNHVLINFYQPGCGIMPHEDGPLYHPVVLILSLGSPAVLRFWRKQESGGTGGQPPVASLLAMPRSLLVFQDDAYTHYLHGIEEVAQELLDSSVVNADAVAPALAARTDKQPASQQQQQQQPQDDLQAAQATPSGDGQQQQSAEGLTCCSGVLQQQQQQQHVAAPGSSLVSPGCCCGESNKLGNGAPCSSADTHQTSEAAGSKAGQCAAAAGGCEACQLVVPREGERVSLTIRRVLKVHKALGILQR